MLGGWAKIICRGDHLKDMPKLVLPFESFTFLNHNYTKPDTPMVPFSGKQGSPGNDLQDDDEVRWKVLQGLMKYLGPGSGCFLPMWLD